MLTFPKVVCHKEHCSSSVLHIVVSNSFRSGESKEGAIGTAASINQEDISEYEAAGDKVCRDTLQVKDLLAQ